MSTQNNVRQAWRTRTILEELQRERREALWRGLMQARPVAGVALPRPCDPKPGHFIEQMLAKSHALWLGGIRDVVGYDSRFLLPATCEQAETNNAIRLAEEQDIPAIKRIADQYKNELGFVNRAALQAGISRREVVVALLRGQVVGFVHYHARRDGWHTIYEIAVDRACRGMKVGRALLQSVPRPVRLKCTVDNETANAFYARSMALKGTVAGRKRKLNVWEAA